MKTHPNVLPTVECVDIVKDLYIYRGQAYRGTFTLEQVKAEHDDFVICTPKDPALFC